MLEKYEEGMTKEKAIEMAKAKGGVKTNAKALAYLRASVPKESVFQAKIRRTLEEKYPDGLAVKLAQGYYSQRGIPDIMFVMRGHYFGFEVKRPILGQVTPIQEWTMSRIRGAGGTAEAISYPEEAVRIVEEYFREDNDGR